MTGAGIILFLINLPLGLAALTPAYLFQYLQNYLSMGEAQNAESAKSTGNLSAEVQESLGNFKVIIAFNRRDYFRRRFEKANRHNYIKSVKAGIANNLFIPVYTLAANIGQLIVLALGILSDNEGTFYDWSAYKLHCLCYQFL